MRSRHPGVVDPARLVARRSLLLGAAGTTAGALLGGCSGDGPAQRDPQPATSAPRPAGSGGPGTVSLVYFSRAGENSFNGGRRRLTVGNTQVVADMIQRLTGCDVHRVEAADPYPEDYDPTVRRNVEEQNANARPAVANPLTSIEPYRTVLLGSPIWNVRAPMIMSTVAERLDFSGRTVHPFVTYAVSGLGNVERDYAASCRGATFGEALAVRGEEAADAGAAVEAWLRRIGLLTR